MSNRLAHESSPYLKQHQNNPVDWYPWGEEALSRSRKENRPILLSVGYSACHWCHVMAHESFENEQIARLMNDHFINIKVDREERPDLDQIYQNVAQVFTHSGGWPLTVFLTPELKPFFGGTYFPPDDRYGRPGFARVLAALHQAYHQDSASVQENAEKITGVIGSLETVGEPTGVAASQPPTASALKKSVESLVSHVDWTHGGMGGAPKFPNPMVFNFLWRMSLNGVPVAREAVLLSLTRMAQGGIYDHLGGGFHRYSVDESWSVPHFEKMLYDNGLLLKLYAEVLLTDREAGEKALSSWQRELFTDVLRETVEYVLREMTSSEGGFYAAQDADSEGEEGKFFVWDPSELKASLLPEEAQAIASRYGVTESGNFEHGKTVLYQAMTVDEVATRMKLSETRVRSLLATGRAKLFTDRSKRIAPGLDHKILTAWNGLMISGLCWAHLALKMPGTGSDQARNEAVSQKALKAARGAFGFILSRATQSSDKQRLFSTVQEGKGRFNGYLDDYAFMAMAALDLARVSDDQAEIKSCLEESVGWIEAVLKHFKDESANGYYFTSDDHEKLLQRPKSASDQAIPSGTAVTLNCLLALAEIDLNRKSAVYAAEASSQLGGLFSETLKNPFGFGELLSASLLSLSGPVVVSGADGGQICQHPHLFQKPSGPSGILICHRQSCSLPIAEIKQARSEALKKSQVTF